MKKLAALAIVVSVMGAAVGAWALGSSSTSARATLSPHPVPSGTPLGYVQITEIGSGYLGQQINISGQVAGLVAGQPYGLHLFKGTCAALNGHLAGAGQQHPSHAGDLPNIRPSSTGTFSITKATNRFTLSNETGLNWNALASGGAVAVVVDSVADTGGAPGPTYACGQLVCNGGVCFPGT